MQNTPGPGHHNKASSAGTYKEVKHFISMWEKAKAASTPEKNKSVRAGPVLAATFGSG